MNPCSETERVLFLLSTWEMEVNSFIGRSRIAAYAFSCAILVCIVRATDAQQSHSIGVAPYVQPQPTRVRLVFGYGGNVGLHGFTPSSFIGNASYESGAAEWTAGFISSTSITNDLPRRSYFEFDLMYGIPFDALLDRYEGPSDGLHTSLSAGLSLDSYQERWRPYGRRSQPNIYYPATTFQYSLGVPIQFQADYEPFRFVGIGALLFYNASALSPSYGAAIVLEARY